MTFEEMQHGLNALQLALSAKGFPDDGDGPRLYIGLRDTAVVFCQRDYRQRIIRARMGGAPVPTTTVARQDDAPAPPAERAAPDDARSSLDEPDADGADVP